MSKYRTILLYILLLIVILFAGCEKNQNDQGIGSVTPTSSPTAAPTNLPVNSPTAIPTVIPTAMPTNIPTAIPTVTAAPTTIPTAVPPTIAPTSVPVVHESGEKSSKKKMIAIDAGHQNKGNYDEEPIGPGAKTTKAKVSSGTQGAYTGVAEYKLNLVIAKKVKEELIDRGYEVFMIRETNDVNLSNRERAEMANESGADLFIRIHADGSTDPDVNGASTLYPSEDNPYVSELSDPSYDLSKYIIDAICEQTGAKNRGAIARDDMSGINWCSLPVSIIEMGYMSNKKEDKLMQTEDYQDKIVQGICDGIDEYYE